MSAIKTARDDIRAAVNALAAVVARGVTASATWIPEYDRGSITDLQIDVTAADRTINLVSRGGVVTDDITVSVSIMEPLIDALVDDPQVTAEGVHILAEAIAGLVGQRLATAGTVTAASVVVLDPEAFREKRLARSVVELTVRI